MTPRSCVSLHRFVDVLKLLHIVGVLFTQQLLLSVEWLCAEAAIKGWILGWLCV